MKVLVSDIWSYYTLKYTHILYNTCLDFGSGNCLPRSGLYVFYKGQSDMLYTNLSPHK